MGNKKGLQKDVGKVHMSGHPEPFIRKAPYPKGSNTRQGRQTQRVNLDTEGAAPAISKRDSQQQDFQQAARAVRKNVDRGMSQETAEQEAVQQVAKSQRESAGEFHAVLDSFKSEWSMLCGYFRGIHKVLSIMYWQRRFV